MPTPSMARLPKLMDEKEFEKVVLDALKLRWKDPNASLNGRKGQAQDGVDIFGRPKWLSGSFAGAQCKNSETLTISMIK